MATQILGKVAYTSKGAYDSSFSYEINDVVTYNGSSYVSLKETKGNLPTNTEYWMLLAKKGDTYEVTEDDLNNIANQITEEANSSFNQNVDSKTKEFNTNASNKIDDFNSNASSKTETFNTNAVEKTTLFNENATTKLSEYNTNHDTKLETYNTNADERLQEFNDNANSYNERITINAEDIDDNTLRIKRLETDIFDSGEASGNSINIKDSALAEFQEVTIDGVCEQVTTNGNQLLDFSTQPSDSKTTHTFENDVLTINADGSTPYQSFYKRVTDLVKNNSGKKIGFDFESFTFENNHSASWVQLVVNYNDGTATSYHTLLTNGLVKTTYTIPDDTSNIKSVDLPIYATTSPAMANTIKIVKPLLYFDDNNVYEPYSGGQASPRPDWEQPIEVIDEAFNVKSVGKNLLNLAVGTQLNGLEINVENGNEINVSGTPTQTWSNITAMTYENIEKGTYTFSIKESTQVCSVSLYTVSKSGVVREFQIPTGTLQKKVTFTEDVRSYRVYIFAMTAGTEIDTTLHLQLERGDATELEPYQESKIEIILPDGEFAGKIDDTSKDQFKIKWNDEDKNYHLYLEKNIGKVILDGSQNVTYFGVHADHNLFQSINLTDANYNQPAKIISKCDKYISVPNNRVNGMLNFQLRIRHTDAIICWNDDRFDNADDMKKDLQNKPMTLYYVLAEPYTIDLGSVDMLLSYYPVTNVFTDSELNPNINAKYYREFVATIRNLQVNNGTLQSELADVQTRLSALETSLNNLLVSQVESEVVE